MNTPNAIRDAVAAEVKRIMAGCAPVNRMDTKEALQLIDYVSRSVVGIVLARIGSEMMQQTLDELQPSGACTDPLDIARDLGFRAGRNSAIREWSKLFTNGGAASALAER